MKVYIKGALSIKEIAEMCGGTVINETDKKVTLFTTDSRELSEGALFIAIKGTHFDGNDYVASAEEKGAVCSLAERVPEGFDGCVILVKDTRIALGEIARAYKDKIRPLTVAVTGSVGKTTTKEFIYAVLSEKYKALKTEGNFNSDIGLPMTLLGLERDDTAAVLEMGMSAAGEIEYLSRLASPKIAVVTNIGSAHIGLLGSREAIRDAKLEIRRGLKKDGVLILNGDEPLLWGIEGAIYVSRENENADYFVYNVIEGENGIAFDIKMKKDVYESIFIPAIGEHNVMNAALAFAVGVCAGLGEFEIRRGLMKFKNAEMRQQIGVSGGRTVLKDCYNASPESMLASLKVLSSMTKRSGSRAVAVLGDMRELGEHSVDSHRRIGGAVSALGIDVLVTVGAQAEEIAKSALYLGMKKENVYIFRDESRTKEIGEALLTITRSGDTVLFKASRAVALEKVAKYIEA